MKPITTATVVAVLGVLAFAAGLTKRWVLDPLGDWFGGLDPSFKALVVLCVVVGVIAAISIARLRHRRDVQAALRVVESEFSA